VELTFDAAGLIPAIAQDRLTGQVRMVAFMSRDALAATLRTGKATFYSRSRQALWEKGAESGHSLHVRSIHADCDRDALLLLVDPVGPTCHTGSPSCFFRTIDAQGASSEDGEDACAFLQRLERTILARKADAAASASYTRTLLDAGATAIGAKLREEAEELGRALESESDQRVAAEAADLLYHLLVGLASRGVELRTVLETLASRSGRSGHDEKRARGSAPG
jgi:phosphoribosyl-ATP pyrophosphohydrolase/phosphoribosyl-AMP cyclohydrolase